MAGPAQIDSPVNAEASDNEQQQLTQLMSLMQNANDIMLERSMLGSKLGTSHNGNRDIYTQAGYPETGTLRYTDFRARYERQDIARRLVTVFPDATWRERPIVLQNEEAEETEFEKEWDRLVKRTRLYHYLRRADILANIGEYSILLLGFDDGQDISKPVNSNRANKLIYTQVYSQYDVTIKEWETDTSSPRFGSPKVYQINIDSNTENSSAHQTRQKEVHYTRVLHVADGMLENDWKGTPVLKTVYNRLQDLETVMASSAEGFWRNAWPGFAAVRDKDARWLPGSEENMENEIQKYIHQLTRFMRLEGMNLQEISADIESPRDHVDAILDLICSTIGCPKSVFLSQEGGQNSSEQDRSNWDARVDERRNHWATPTVITQMIRRLVEANAVPQIEPEDVVVRWPTPRPSERTQADIARLYTVALATYFKIPGLRELYPPEEYFKRILGHTEDQVKVILEAAKEQIGDEDADETSEGETDEISGPNAGLEPAHVKS